MIAALDDIGQSFGIGTVVARLGVSERTARDWLERWRDAGFVEPTRAGVKRIHNVTLAARWREPLA